MQTPRQPSFGAILWAYCQKHFKVLLAYLLFAGIFALVFTLNKLPLSPILYAALLSAVVEFLLFCYGFWQYYRRHKLLCGLYQRITVDLAALPEPKDLLEQDYRMLLEQLSTAKMQAVSKADRKQTELIDYYTLWAHQIKTPIAALRLLLQSQENTAQNHSLELELFKIEQYVEMVLQYLRLEGQSSDLLLQSYSLDDIVKQAVRKYAPMFILKKVKLELQDLNCDVLTDEKWLVFVVEQLLSNALKYTPAGSISIYLKPGGGQTLVVADTGIGIQQEDLPRIFEKGFTGYNGRLDKKSTGIGLYLCQRVLQKLGHSLRIQSQVGQGTQVEIDLNSIAIPIE